MKELTSDKWKIKKGVIIECIIENCKREPFNEGYCLKHLDKEIARRKAEGFYERTNA